MSVCGLINSRGMWEADCHPQPFLGKEIGFLFGDEAELVSQGAVKAPLVRSEHGGAGCLHLPARGASSMKQRVEAGLWGQPGGHP